MAAHFAATEGLEWLKAGWRDLRTQPVPSIAYGVGVFLASVVFVWLLAYRAWTTSCSQRWRAS